uniref:Rose intensity 1 n=1 Tax=Erythranthe cardinalis TaxID=188299 RepID=L7VJB8_9LAMI|nr:rose intensity 1 [Erythranthe cardinalis]
MASSENSSSDDYFSTSQEVNKKETKVQVQLSKDEEDLVIRMYNLVGDRWPLIAGRIPGRSADQIKKYWLSRYSTTAFPKQKINR